MHTMMCASIILPIATDVSARGPSVCLSHALMHPAKAVGGNEMPFGMDTVAPNNIVLDGGPSIPTGWRDLGLELQ